MHIVINDFGGYAFIGQLARELANQGHEVKHLFCASLHTTPKGVQENDGSTTGYSMMPVSLAAPLNKYSLIKRRSQEIEYGRAVARMLRDIECDVVFSANTPLDAQKRIWAAVANKSAKRVFWLQDIIGLATQKLLAKRIPVAGAVVGQLYANLEQRLLRQSNHVIAISSAFGEYLNRAAIPESKITVIENWAPLEQIPVKPRLSAWAEQHGLHDGTVFTYSGTLSLKHNPKTIWDLALALEDRNATVVVRSQGAGADWLCHQLQARPLRSLRLMDFAPYHEFPDVLAASDVLIALLEQDAGEYSVPSKVLSYLCAGRAVLAAMPLENLASKIVRDCGAGRIVAPGDSDAFIAEAMTLLDDAARRAKMGSSARKYAECTFDITSIAGKFKAIASGTT